MRTFADIGLITALYFFPLQGAQAQEAKPPAAPPPAAAATAPATNEPAAKAPATNAPSATQPQASTNTPPAAPKTNEVAAAQPATAPEPAKPAAKPQLPAEQLLPAETFLVFTIKDWPQSFEALKKSPFGLLWQDDALRPLREKFYNELHEDLFKSFQKESGLQVTNYFELLRGQVTVALTTPAEETKGPGILLIIDTKEKAEGLKTRLAEMTKLYTDAGNQIKREKIRDVEFATFEFTRAAVDKATGNFLATDEDAEPDEATKDQKVSLTIGQSESLLIAATEPKDIEKVLARQSGGMVPALAEQAVFQQNYNAMFRESPAFVWLNFKPLYEQMIKPDPDEQPRPEGMSQNLTAAKIFPALGLNELKSVAAAASFGPEGYGLNLFLSAPEGSRQGVLKILAPPAKDAGPPPFVPADAVKFTRMRLDFPEAWNTLEGALVKIDTGMAGMVKMMLELAGKDKDPNFDLRKSLIASVGDDFITYEKAPRGPTAFELANPPSITLIGAREPEQLLNGVRVVLSLLPEPIATAPLKEREFLGRKIYYIPLVSPEVPGQPAVEREVQFASSGGYVAISTDRAMVEEFLRSSENPPKPLRDAPGFIDAAQKVGGFNTGWFGFENAAESARATFAALEANPAAAPALPLGAQGAVAPQEFFDFSLLPPFERVAKYFGNALFSVSSTPEGIVLKFNMPRPAGLN